MKSTTILLPVLATLGAALPTRPSADVAATENAHPGVVALPHPTCNGEVDPTKTHLLLFPEDGEDGPVIIVPNAIGDWKRSADDAATAVEQPPLRSRLPPLFLPPVDGYLDPEKMPFPFFMLEDIVVVVSNFLPRPTSGPLSWYPQC